MSECPNCGSRPFMDGQREWLCGTSINYPTRPSTMCRLQAAEALIRSLREELAAARDAERDLIADWLRTCNPSKTAPHLAGCFGSADKLANAIRNNEHRKGDQ